MILWYILGVKMRSKARTIELIFFKCSGYYPQVSPPWGWYCDAIDRGGSDVSKYCSSGCMSGSGEDDGAIISCGDKYWPSCPIGPANVHRI